MVRLKVQYQNGDIVIVNEFQFHNGSIKSVLGWPQERFDDMFQFHNGSIKGTGLTVIVSSTVKVSIPQWFD